MTFNEIKKKVNLGNSLTEEENKFLFEFMDYLDSDEQREEVRKILVVGNMGLTIHLLKKITYSNKEFDDMKQDASIGLIQAVDSFKKEKGNAFSTFAFPVIRNHVYSAFRTPKHTEKNEGELGKRTPRIEILPFNDSNFQSASSDLDLECCILKKERLEMVKKAMDSLSKEERILIYEKFFVHGKGLTYEELAKKHHMNLSKVYRIIQKAINKMKKFLQEKKYE